MNPKVLVLSSKNLVLMFLPTSAPSGSGFKTLTEGQKVKFTVTQAKGPQAENIEPI